MTHPPERRYHERVTALAVPDGRWYVRLALSDDAGREIKSAGITELVFPTRQQAEDTGWRIVDEWVRRFAENARDRSQ